MESFLSIGANITTIATDGPNVLEAFQRSDELFLLRRSLPKARLLNDRAEWGRFKNKELAALLSQLRDTTYDAEDILREFDDQELRQKMENADRSRAGQLLSSSLDLAKSLIHRSKTRVKETQSRLDKAVAEIEGALRLLGLNVEPVQLMPETSSVIGAPQVLGRDEERDLLIEKLGVTIGRDHELDQVIELLGVRSAGASGKRAAAAGTGIASTSRAKRQKGESSRAGNVSVLAIVGIGGVGKTTLAQYIYNDVRVKAHFGVRIWVCVSDLFNKRRITKEIIESISGEDINPSRSLDTLQGELMEHLKGKRFLLVLDDIWPIANVEWEAFYAPVRHGLEGSMVLVTTRFQKVADLVATVKPVELEGLPTAIFWEFFKKCALVCPREREMVLPPSLRRLSIHYGCGELDKSFPGCLENLTSLTLLHLEGCNTVESIPLSSIDTSELKCLVLWNCPELSSIGGLDALSSIQYVKISDCPKLTEIQQPFKKKGLPTKEEKELLKFVGPRYTRRSFWT